VSKANKEFPESTFKVENGIGTPVTLTASEPSHQESIELEMPQSHLKREISFRDLLTPPFSFL